MHCCIVNQLLSLLGWPVWYKKSFLPTILYIIGDWRFLPGINLLIPLLYYLSCYVNPSKISLLRVASVFRESGCKDKDFFKYAPNFFRTFFEKSFSLYQSVNHSPLSVPIGVPFVLESGCKSRGFLNTRQTFSPLFLKKNACFLLTRCYTIML